MSKYALVALAFLFSSPAWSQATPAATDPANRPGGTTQIAPTPGPATSPALPSPSLPQAAVQNRENAQAAKTERKAKKKTKKPSKQSKPASSSTKTKSNTAAGTGNTAPAR